MCERPVNQPRCKNLGWVQIQATIKTDKNNPCKMTEEIRTLTGYLMIIRNYCYTS